MEKEGLLSGEPVYYRGCESKCGSSKSRCRSVCGIVSSFFRTILTSLLFCTATFIAYETFYTGLDSPLNNFKDVAYCTRNATLSIVSSHGSAYHECRVRSLWCRDWSSQCFLAYDAETFRAIELRYTLEQNHPKQNISVEPLASDFDLVSKSHRSLIFHSDPSREIRDPLHILSFASYDSEHLGCQVYKSFDSRFGNIYDKLYGKKHNLDSDADFGPGITPIGFSANHTRLPWSIVQEVWANKTGIPTHRVKHSRYGDSSEVACFPSTGGVWIADLYPVDLEHLSLDRFNDVLLPPTDTKEEQAREDELCTQLRGFGASWYPTDPPRYNGYSYDCRSSFQWCIRYSPCAGNHVIAMPNSGGAWILDLDDYYEEYYKRLHVDDLDTEDWETIRDEWEKQPRIDDAGKAWTMDEKADIIKGLGAKFYERLEDFAPLEESGVLEGNFTCDDIEPEDDEGEDLDHWYGKTDLRMRKRSPVPRRRLKRSA